MATRSNGRSKREFVDAVLRGNPRAGTAEVNRAWTEAGGPGTISRSLIGKVRSERASEGPTMRRIDRPSPELPASGNGTLSAGVRTPDHEALIAELERDLDRILFRVMGLGDRPELERQIRRCRRTLILGEPS
jgi:hypothetical protein